MGSLGWIEPHYERKNARGIIPVQDIPNNHGKIIQTRENNLTT